MNELLNDIPTLRSIFSAVVWAMIWLSVGLWAGAGIMRRSIPAKPE